MGPDSRPGPNPGTVIEGGTTSATPATAVPAPTPPTPLAPAAGAAVDRDADPNAETADTGPSATGPSATGRSATGPSATGPSAAGPRDAGLGDTGLTETAGTALARLAAGTVAARLRREPPDGRLPEEPALRALGASFVTLENRGRLRGCVGTLEASRPLYLDVMRNARRAMNDPRLPEVTSADWPYLDVKVSVLSRPEHVPATSRRELLAQLRPGVDGLLLAAEGRRATFLPAVWQKLPDAERFLSALLAKGGWPDAGWPDGMIVARYTSVEFADRSPRPALPDPGPANVSR